MTPETRAAVDHLRTFLDDIDACFRASGLDPETGRDTPVILAHGYDLTIGDLRHLLAAADGDTPSTTGPDRCPDVLRFEPARHHPDEQCALYDGHPGRHQTQPLAPIREDGADGVHMFLWTSDARGIVTEVNEQRIDDDPDETFGDLDV